ncbi:MAG: TlpA family protein disulfide reductase [candidate division Zixibacteria bacterium]|nr:TlpA family protein disulfide reductase [candidate division Zixibacteria bacterium]
MIKKLFPYLMFSLCALALMLAACTQKTETSTARLDPPVFYDDEAITQARGLINEGYALLDNNLEGAIAKFAEVEQLVPSGLVGPYHIACAYGRTGNIEAAFAQLNLLLDNGYDLPDNLRYDTDLESLSEDPRMEKLIAQAEANYKTASVVFADGMPEYDPAPVTFATQDELNEWTDTQNRQLRNQSQYWTSVQSMRARMDFASKRLAAFRELKGDDPEFNYGLERLRQSARLKSSYEYGWGTISDMVVDEATTFLATNPTEEATGEANYLAAFALSQKYGEEAVNRADGFRQADTYLAKVAEGNVFYGAAKALGITNKLQTPGANVDELGPQLKAVIEQFPEDNLVYRVVGTRFANSGAQYIWPVELGMEDLKGKTITLNEYQGKALLIDFWATWCSPCLVELPNMVKVYNKYHSQGLEIVSISLDYTNNTTTEAYKQWIDSVGMNWRHTYSGNGWGTESVKRFLVSSIPAPFLVGPDGSLVAWGEALRGKELENAVKKTLGI